MTLGTSEVVSWKSSDGAVIEGVLRKPAGFRPGTPAPLLVIIHGGPTGVSRPTLFGATYVQGGYISAFLTTHDSARFRAVSVGAGISNWVTYYVSTDIHPFTRQYLKATPWDDPEVYRKTSPMTYIKGGSAPTLIQHGDADLRVPVSNALELYQGLRDQGVTTRLALYRGFGHGLNKPKAVRHALQENLDWFDAHLFGAANGN